MYATRYAPNEKVLEYNLRSGVLLNDITFFFDEGYVEMIQEDGTLRQASFDHLVQGGIETPNLPPISSVNSETGDKHRYQYIY